MTIHIRFTAHTCPFESEIREAIENTMVENGLVMIGHIVYREDQTTLIRACESYRANVDSSIPPGDLVRVPISSTEACHGCGEIYYSDYPNRVSREGHGFCSEECLDEHNLASGMLKVMVGSGHEWFTGDQLLPYNSRQSNFANATAKDPYVIGFEVEKEDCGYLDCYDEVGDLVRDAYHRGWLCVSDGSLDEYGFELVSPAYNLTATDGLWSRRDLQRDCEEYHELNADYTGNCGGHITLSKLNMTGPELINHLGEFPALLFALYPSRLRGEYAYGRTKDQTKISRDKFRAINCQDNRVEFRIFSAVRSGENLEWRTRLVHEATILADRGVSISEALEDKTSPLVNILLEKVSFFEDMKERFESFLKFWETGLIEDNVSSYFEN